MAQPIEHQKEKEHSIGGSIPASQEAKEPIEHDTELEPIAEDNYQYGIQKVRAITKTWSTRSMWTLFALLWLVSLADQLLVSVNGSLGPYMTSRFQRHGLVASMSIVSTIAGGTSHLTFAKIADVWGRVQTFMFVLLLQVVAQVMKAGANNIETFVAGDVFYWVAHIGMIGVIDLIIADTTTLKNRMIMLGINGTPLIISVFAGPEIANHFLENNIRWAFGAFAIIITVFATPPIALLLWWEHRAFQAGAITRRQSERTIPQSIVYYLIQFDILGIFLLTAAFAIFLLPFSLVTYAPNGWSTGYIIAMLVIGLCLFPVFFVWEAYFTPVAFLKWEYIKERTIIGSCILYGVMFMSTFIWNAYFRSYLQVVHRLTVQTADYTLNTYSLSSAFFMPFIGWLIRVTGRFKWIAYGGLPILLLGTALLIPFRQPDTDVGLLVMTQLFVGIGAAFWVTCGYLAIMAPVTQQEIAAVLAVWGLFGSMGASTGFAIAGALWNNVLPEELAKRWPANSETTPAAVFADLVLQLSFADGTPEREALVGAYGYVQRIMVITGVALIPLCLLAIFIWKDINVKKVEKEKGQQTAGNVF